MADKIDVKISDKIDFSKKGVLVVKFPDHYSESDVERLQDIIRHALESLSEKTNDIVGTSVIFLPEAVKLESLTDKELAKLNLKRKK